MCAAVLVGALVACGPEPMTVKQVCSAHENMEKNRPKGEVAEAKYKLGYYQKWSQRIDGALGDAFSDLAKSAQTVIAEGGIPHEGKVSDDYYRLWYYAYKDVVDICG